MTVAEKMIAFRKYRGYSTKEMAQRCEVSEVLIKIVEKGLVTHPKLAERIAKEYELEPEEAQELIPTIHRKDHPDYNPGAFKTEGENWSMGNGIFFKDTDDNTELRGYLAYKKHRHVRGD